MNFHETLPRYGEALLRLFYPSRCAACEKLLELEERGICRVCLEGFQKLKFLPSEERIRVPLTHGEEAWALFRYEGLIKDLVHRIKFDRRRDLLEIFSGALSLFLERRPGLGRYDLILPVPLDPRRQWQREFNQSALLAQRVRKCLLSRGHDLPVKERGLTKRRSTPPQSLLGREARKLNLDQTFRVSSRARVRSKSILLVDDIFTTGATLEEAAKTLKAQGASRVGCLALTRALLH